MRKLLTTMIAGVMVCAVANAESVKLYTFTSTISTNAAVPVTNDLYGTVGWVHELSIVPVSADTGVVSVVAIPSNTNLAAVVLATNATISAEGTFRPRFDGTDTAGSALTGDPPQPFLAAGDTIRFVVTGTNTGTVYNATLKLITQ